MSWRVQTRARLYHIVSGLAMTTDFQSAIFTWHVSPTWFPRHLIDPGHVDRMGIRADRRATVMHRHMRGPGLIVRRSHVMGPFVVGPTHVHHCFPTLFLDISVVPSIAIQCLYLCSLPFHCLVTPRPPRPSRIVQLLAKVVRLELPEFLGGFSQAAKLSNPSHRVRKYQPFSTLRRQCPLDFTYSLQGDNWLFVQTPRMPRSLSAVRHDFKCCLCPIQ